MPQDGNRVTACVRSVVTVAVAVAASTGWRAWLPVGAVRGELRRSAAASACQPKADHNAIPRRPGPTSTTFAPNDGLGDVTSGSSFFNPHASTAALAFTAQENAPINVIEVAGRAAAYKVNRHDLLFLVVFIVREPAGAVEIAPPDKPTTTRLFARPGRFCILYQEPGRKNPRADCRCLCSGSVVGNPGNPTRGARVTELLVQSGGNALFFAW